MVQIDVVGVGIGGAFDANKDNEDSNSNKVSFIKYVLVLLSILILLYTRVSYQVT